MDDPLITKYRPITFSEVLGHDEMMANSSAGWRAVDHRTPFC